MHSSRSTEPPSVPVSPCVPVVESSVSDSKVVMCDGCWAEVGLGQFHAILSAGNQVRYCDDCERAYTDWKNTCIREEERMNKLLLLFIEDTRRHVPLKLVPEDFPARVFPQQSGMGVLRLG